MSEQMLDCSDIERWLGKPIAPALRWGHGFWIILPAGEWGRVVHSRAAYRGPALCGDITILSATIDDKRLDDEGRNSVQLEMKMTNQLDTELATAQAEIELPTKM